MNTILVRLIGGLGNQMFQYAAGKRMALLNGAALVLDTSAFRSYKLHRFSLQHFELEAPEARDWEMRRIRGEGGLRSLLARLGDWRGPVIQTPLSSLQKVVESGFEYDEKVLGMRGSLYLDGYWQSPRYFEPIAEEIRKDFRVKTEPGPGNKEMAERILSTNAVSLHVRRGDYTANAKTQSIHGGCSTAYYEAAVRRVCELEGDVCFFVFSDEIEWARQHLNLPGKPVFVDLNSALNNYDDLRLMSLCRHHIIANSSFSWWGAWLGRPDGITIAPSRWMNDSAKGPSAEGILPPPWIKISPEGVA